MSDVGKSAATAEPGARRPNILIVMTDPQRANPHELRDVVKALRPATRRAGARRAAVGCLALALLLGAGCESDSSSKSPPGEAASGSYVITVYYTAVESFHGGARIAVRGCPSQDCAFGDEPLGEYPRSFVNAVRDEGTGRITTGPHAGRYLNWSHDVGFWLDTVPANAHGQSLVPFRTAAADPNVLPRGTRFRIEAPLIQDNGAPLEGEAARRLLAATWEIQDEFTPGLGGPLRLDLHIGEEDRANFTETGPLYIALQGVRIRLQ